MPYEDKVTNKIKYKVFHIGTIDNNYIFIPNLNFRHLDNEEKKKYIFPDMWDISKAILDMNSENDTDFNSELKNSKDIKPSDTIIDQYNNRLYGSFWLLFQIAIKTGLYDDLVKTFDNNLLVMEANRGIMMYNYLRQSNDYDKVFNIYHEAIKLMFKED